MADPGVSRDRMALAEIARIVASTGQLPSTGQMPQLASTGQGTVEQRSVAGDGQVAGDGKVAGPVHGCRIMPLPPRLREKAAQVAVRVNPVNAPLREQPSDGVIVTPPQRLTLLPSKYWGPTPRVFSVSFMESTPADLRARIVSHLNAWSQSTGMSFAETGGTGEVRIARGPNGHYSYLGTDILLIPPDQQTMNLDGFSMATSEEEFRRVVRHEAGHSLGFPHEHMREELVAKIDPAKAYAYFLASQGWSKEVVDQQVLTPLEESSILGTPSDQDSIMCYPIPGEITRDGQPIRGGLDIGPSDHEFAGTVYPKLVGTAQVATVGAVVDWDPAKDVSVPV